MKKSEALTMPIGRAMDRAVFEYVWGVDPMDARQGHLPDGEIEYWIGYPLGHDVAPKLSAPGDGCETLIEKMQVDSWIIKAHFKWSDCAVPLCDVEVYNIESQLFGKAIAPTQREALCRAVLWAFADDDPTPTTSADAPGNS